VEVFAGAEASALLQGKRTRWQQSPFLLTASKSVPEEEETEKKE
jgi:membrane protein